MKRKIKKTIPPHCNEALKEVEEFCLYYDYADYLDNNHIIAYKKWGRGYMKHIIERQNDG